MLYSQPEFEFLIYRYIASDMVPAKPLINLRRRVAKICGHLVLRLSEELQLQAFNLSSRMRTCLALIGLWACFFSQASATALTYKLVANEKACFFSNVEQQGAKIAFYFAVSHSICAYRAITMS